MVCPFNIRAMKPEEFKCGDCRLCEDKNNQVNKFDNDLEKAKAFEEELKEYVLKNTGLTFVKNTKHKTADLSFYKRNQLICRVEAKLLGGRAATFMESKIGLSGKESLVVDEPKYEHYVKTNKEDNLNSYFYIPTFVVWRFNRPCKDFGGITVFEEIQTLDQIYKKHPERKFERKTNENDIKNGTKLGVTRKTHFSISEMLPIYELTFWIFKAIQEYEDVLDKILDYIRKIQREKNINDNFDIEEIKTNLTMFIQFYGKEKMFKYVQELYLSLSAENMKYFLMNLIFDKTKIHERVKKYTS